MGKGRGEKGKQKLRYEFAQYSNLQAPLLFAFVGWHFLKLSLISLGATLLQTDSIILRETLTASSLLRCNNVCVIT